MRRLWTIALSVSALTPLALGDDPTPGEPLAPIEEVREVYPVGYPPRGYSSRAIGVVYNNAGESGTSVSGQTQGVCSWADEYNFANGPWASVSTRLATELIVWVQSSGTVCPDGTQQSYDILVDFYDPLVFSYVSNPMISGAPFHSVRLAVTGTCGIQTAWVANLTGLPGGGLLMPGPSVVIAYRLVEPGTTTLRPHPGNGTGTQSNFPVFCTAATLIGTSTPSYARDVNGNQILEGGTPVVVGVGAGHEHRSTSATINRNQRGRIRGDIPPAPPPPHTDLGAIPDAGASATAALGANAVNWYAFTLNGNATDAALAFLDVTTEGSTHPDPAIAMYRPDGTLVASDLDDGSTTNAHLTFGVGRRDATGDGRQLDGRDGQTNAGTYYLAVGAASTVFTDGWGVTNPSAAAGDVTLTFTTNTNGAPLAPSVAPAATDMGQILSPGMPNTLTTVPRSEIVWWKFEKCADISGANYLDVDFSQSVISANSEAFLFDANGNQIATNDDADADGVAPLYQLSQLSFGNTGPRPPFNAAARDFAGQDGNLPPGVYYLGVGLFNVTALAAPTTAGRWHLRSNSGSTLGVKPDLITNVVQCGPTCGSADFDGDGDTGTDADIEAFFACLAGTCCATCGIADFDGDGDTGTDADIEAFFRVLSGNPC